MKNMIVSMPSLVFLLWMGQEANGEDTLNIFLKDMISKFSLTSPTIVYNSDEEAPDICYTEKWVSCVHTGLATFYPDDDGMIIYDFI